MEPRKKRTRTELRELREELAMLRERYRRSEEKRKSLAKEVCHLKEGSRLRPDRLELAERKKLIDLVEGEKEIKNLEENMMTLTGRRQESWTELAGGEDPFGRSSGRVEDEKRALDKLTAKVMALRELSAESSRRLQDKLSRVQEKERLVSNVKNEIEKMKEFMRIKSKVLG